MKLKCMINGKEYEIAQGNTFVDEYNETLDSANIIIPQTEKIETLNAYDDVYIYSTEKEFKGFKNQELISFNFYNKTIEGTLKSSNVYVNKKLIDFFENESQDKNVWNHQIVLKWRDEKTGGEYISTNFINYDLIKKDDGKYYFVNSLNQGETGGIAYKKEYLIDTNNSITRDGETYYFVLLTYWVNDKTEQEFEFIKCNFFYEIEKDKQDLPLFYKHFLIDTWNEEQLILTNNNLFKYKITLFSETKGLETKVLPNRSLTQPLNVAKKINCYDLMQQYIELYSPKYKLVDDEAKQTWTYIRKYNLSKEVKEKFSNVYCPEFSLNLPTLRDVLNQIMLTKDCIPYVFNNTIYYIDLSKRNGVFNFDSKYFITNDQGQTSNDYADVLKRTHNNAISQFKTAQSVRLMGFRNKDNALLTIGNMRLELDFPIYEINRVLLCYFKKADVYDIQTGEKTRTLQFLCKQDITKLVLPNTKRDLLSLDWQDFTNDPPGNIDELAQYKLATVGYNIGDTTIEGWGTQYEYPEGWWDINKTYIENIIRLIDNYNPTGIYTLGYFFDKLNPNEKVVLNTESDFFDRIITSFKNNENDSIKLKAFLFEIDYNALYNGTCVVSKNNALSQVEKNDNSSSSLSVLEIDGLFQKEKIDRYGNPIRQMVAKYPDISYVQQIGSVYGDDQICYHREIAIWQNEVVVVYYLIKDYVLKYYFTSVFSKLRVSPLISYNESVLRSENLCQKIILSKKYSYFETENNIDFVQWGNKREDFKYKPLQSILSFMIPSSRPVSIDNFVNDFFDTALIRENDVSNGITSYENFSNLFVSGKSLCFNIKMTDNASAGVYIGTPEPKINATILQPTDDDYTGSVQRWYLLPKDIETGNIKSLGFYLSKISNYKKTRGDYVQEFSQAKVDNYYNSYFFKKPDLRENFFISAYNTIGKDVVLYKDNKEVIDMTLQFEPLTYVEEENDVIFSNKMMQLSSYLSTLNKWDKDTEIVDFSYTGKTLEIFNYIGKFGQLGSVIEWLPFFVLRIDKSLFNDFKNNPDKSLNPLQNCSFINNGYIIILQAIIYDVPITWDFIPTRYEFLDDDTIKIYGLFSGIARKYTFAFYSEYFTENEISIIFKRSTNVEGNEFPEQATYFYFSNYDNLTHNPINKLQIKTQNGSFIDVITCFSTPKSSKECIPSNFDLSDGDKNPIIFNFAGSATNKKTYKKNMYILLSKDKINKTIVENEYSFDSFKNNFSNLNVQEVIYYQNGNNESADLIYINLQQIPDLENINSISYWYIENESCIFVFGVNLTEQDKINKYVKVYVSYVSNNIKDVYNLNNQKVGSIHNYVNFDNKKVYGTNQFYDIIDNNKE